MIAIETRRLSIEIDSCYIRIGRFSLYMQHSRHEYRPTGKLFEATRTHPNSWLIFGLGFRAIFDTNAENQWGMV